MDRKPLGEKTSLVLLDWFVRQALFMVQLVFFVFGRIGVIAIAIFALDFALLVRNN